MSIFRRFWNWIRGRDNRPQPPVDTEQERLRDLNDDEFTHEVLMRAWKSGNMVVGSRGENGDVTIREHKTRANG
jgi:hypothetical protein